MKRVTLSRGYSALVSDKDYQRILKTGPWYAVVKRNSVYAAHCANPPKETIMLDILVYMYVIIACAVGLTVGAILFVLGIVGIMIGGE
jgi:hypothetical protein